MLKESIEKFRDPNYGRIRRSATSYAQATEYLQSNLVRLTELYLEKKKTLQVYDYTFRLIRDDIDNALR